jgi:hypothetical protein
MSDTVSARPFAAPAIATIAAAVTLTPVMTSSANRIPASMPVSLSSAADSLDADSILGAAAPEAFGSDDSGAADFIEGIEELLRYPLDLVEWSISFVPIIGGVVNGVLDAFWDFGVDLVNTPLIPAAEVLTGEVDLGEALGDVGDRFVSAFTDFGDNLIDATGFPLPSAADDGVDPTQFADASDASADAGATDALDPGALADLF